MQAFVLERDYPPLHQLWRDLVLCSLLTPKKNFEIYFFSLFINKESFGRKVSKENSLSCLVPQQERFSEKMAISLFPLFCDFLSVFDVFKAV